MNATVCGALVALLLAGLGAGCKPLPRAYCELGGECDEATGFLDPVPGSSSDSVDVCTVNQETLLKALRANREEVCHQLADAFEAYWACAVDEGCDAFDVTEPECKDELEEVGNLKQEAGNRCNE